MNRDDVIGRTLPNRLKDETMTQAQEGRSMCARPKTWDELDATEKVAALRITAQEQDNRIRHMCDLVDKLLQHDHANGKLVGPLQSNRDYLPDYGYRILV